MTLLDWADGLNAQPDYTKAEFCYLASLVNPAHACLDDVTFENKGYQMMAHAFLPNRFSKPGTLEGTGFNDNDYPQAKFNNALPEYDSWSLDDLAALTHEVMFATDFGAASLAATPVQKAEVLAALRAAPIQPLELYGEVLIARRCLFDTVTEFEAQPVREAHANEWPPTWPTYHFFLVAEMLIAHLEA